MHHPCTGRICRIRLFSHRRRYQKQIASETIVDSGGANPIQKREVGSIWLKAHDKGMRNRNVAIML